MKTETLSAYRIGYLDGIKSARNHDEPPQFTESAEYRRGYLDGFSRQIGHNLGYRGEFYRTRRTRENPPDWLILAQFANGVNAGRDDAIADYYNE